MEKCEHGKICGHCGHSKTLLGHGHRLQDQRFVDQCQEDGADRQDYLGKSKAQHPPIKDEKMVKGPLSADDSYDMASYQVFVSDLRLF